MQNCRFLIIEFLLLTSFTGCSNAQTETFDILSYNAPSNWKKEEKGTFINYIKKGKIKNGFGQISIYKSANSSNNVNADFDNEWKELCGSIFNITATPQKTVVIKKNGWSQITQSSRFDFNGTVCNLLLLSYTDNLKKTSIIINYNDSSVLRDIKSFIGSISLISLGASNNVSNTQTCNNKFLSDDGIVGLWVCYTNNYPISTDMIWKQRFFFNNGKSLTSIPRNGIYNYNIDSENNLTVGSYSFLNGKGTNRKSGEAKFEDKLKLVKPNQLDIDGTIYFKCAKIENEKIDASFTTYANPTDNNLQQLPYGKKPVIHFYKNGKFNDEGLFNIFEYDKDPSNPDATNPGEGSYEIKDFTLFLTYNDGRTKQISLYIANNKNFSNADIIFIAGKQLNKIN